MAQETKQPTEGVQQQQQQPQARPCPQDCRMCPMTQQIFCATKMLFDLSRSQQETSKRLSMLELSLDDIKEQLQPKQEDGQLSIPFAE
jgi:hypothetical protein